MVDLPLTMRSLVAPKYCKPSGFEVVEMPLPTITNPTDVIVRVHAGAIMKGDCIRAAGTPIITPRNATYLSQALFGQLNRTQTNIETRFPLKFGVEGAGVVAAIGPGVKNFKVGDAVYGQGFTRPAFRNPDPGFCSEYAVLQERLLLAKPPQLSFEEAAALPGYTVSAYQVIKRGLELMGEESLEGKTVYIPAAVSGNGFSAIQVAKNVFGAARIISTVSTPKMGLVEEYLPGVVDQLVDYTTTRIADVVPRGSVDFMITTQPGTMGPGIPLLKPRTGVLMSLVSIPRSSLLRDIMGSDAVPFWLGWLLDLFQLWYAFRLRGTSIKYEMVSGNPEIREGLEKAGEAIATGKVKGVFRTVDLSDIDAVRKECEKVDALKGGIGRLVVRVKGK
ncbi:2-methylene-furan-3-one reductase [Colletotrichum sidae]|uniref:2-methylene-furan-3-one reductase n=1 Tax=Colletotrichum sidae TaxID=1347389 RepID=A0A4R8TFH7_9PEZI|nr:2-methylene-furan-3-one reductase [Colletotrichum sidae]